MKVLLAATPMSDEAVDIKPLTIPEPIALEYLGAGIQENHEVKVVDLRLDTEPGLKKTLELFKPDIIGCGATTPEVNPALAICAEAKRLIPGILTVVGGHHASVKPEDFFNKNVDVIVMGEGVHPFKKICDYHEKGKNFKDIENIYYRADKKGTDNKMIFTHEQPFPDLDTLPFPARTLTSSVRHHYTTRLLYKAMPSALIRASTGCFYHCNYCGISALLGHKVHRRSIDKIVEEFVSLEEPFITWIDDEFLLDAHSAISLAKEIEKTGIKKYHFIQSRADTITKNPGCIEEWAKIGLKVAYVGFESHREKDLKAMKKGTNVSKNQEVIRILHANNVIVRGGFMVQPDFNKADFKHLAAYVRELGVDFPTFSVYTPLPGTQSWEETKEKFILHNYNLFDISHTILPTALPLKEFYKEYSKLAFIIGVPRDTKKKLFKAMKPVERWKFILNGMKLYKKVKNGYRAHD